MKLVLIVGLLVVAVFAVDPNHGLEFLRFVHQYQKSYASNSEYMDRYNIFSANMDKIDAHNSQNLGWSLAMNEFGDLTWDEFASTHLGLLRGFAQPTNASDIIELRGALSVPSSVDWVAYGAVAEVKNQGKCGGCWSFATTGSIEGAVQIKTGKLTSLSEQMLIDCSTKNHGCHGGVVDYAFQFVITNNGLCQESAYPYAGAQGVCKTSCTKVSPISSFKDVPQHSETALLAAVAQQPVAVAIEADEDAFQFYSTGVMMGKCGTKLDHGVLVVGYGTENGKNYWTIKNSWGGTWGESGYIRIGRGLQTPYGQCGILMQPSYAVV